MAEQFINNPGEEQDLAEQIGTQYSGTLTNNDITNVSEIWAKNIYKRCGVVMIHVSIRMTATINQTVFTVPEGCRPLESALEFAIVNSAGSRTMVNVRNDGKFDIASPASDVSFTITYLSASI